ncbi:ADP-ribosylation/crystallin J1 [Rhizobium rhizogenes]|nr:ADP-ribosylation/crystallin J1 [Rhizobium rhizogenes]TRB25803.1 ADP-ribosylation/crystallin J1 [Rhizobium rhizogenes]
MAAVETVTLFRPVGLEELKLIEESGWKAFPPRLPDQPIFYPVTNEGYAAQIARDWNTKVGSRRGYVTRFEVNAAYASRFERKVVGGREHEELWVPAEELDEFNRNIIGAIVVTQSFMPTDER